jgi:hypothetical protein
MGSRCVIGGLVLLAVSAGLAADEWQDLYNLRFGKQRKQADASPPKTDDVALAAEHVREAAKFAEQPPFARMLLEQACELGLRDPAGYTTAATAVEKLLRTFPAERATYVDLAVRIYELQYQLARKDEKLAVGRKLVGMMAGKARTRAAAGDWPGAAALMGKACMIAGVVAAPDKDAHVALRTYYLRRVAMERTPKNVALRASVIRHCIAEMGDPAEAKALLTDDMDEVLHTYVPLAAEPVADVAEAACLELVHWYQSLCRTATARGKSICCARAAAYIERYLSLHKARDGDRMKAEVLLAKIRADQATLPPPPRHAAPGGEWVGVLKMVDPMKHRCWSRWKRSSAGLQSLRHESQNYIHIYLPVRPTGSFELEAVFSFGTTKGVVGVFAPAGRGECTPVFHSNGTGGIRSIRGRAGVDNESAVKGAVIAPNQKHTYRLRVEVDGADAMITAGLDGKELIRWSGPQGDLSADPCYDRKGGLMLRTRGTSEILVTSIKVRALSGKLVPVPLKTYASVKGAGRTTASGSKR